MNPFLSHMINHKINTVTAEELSALASQYGFSLSKEQAKSVVKVIQKEKVDITNEAQRQRLLREISNIVNPETAATLNQMINTILRS